MEFNILEWNRVVADKLATGLDAPLGGKRNATNLLAAILRRLFTRGH